MSEGAAPSPAARAALGGLAAALSVVIFHQGMVAALHAGGLLANAPYNLAPYGPLRVPYLADLCFWGGLYGVLFGLALPRLPRPLWLSGLGLGLLAATVGWFVVAPLKGLPLAAGWQPAAMLRSVAINGAWGIGVGLIAPLLLARRHRLAA